MLQPGKIKLGAAVSVLAGMVAIWATLDPWPKIGWTTPSQHQADIAMYDQAIKDFRDEWKCDEWDEELRDKLREQSAGDDSPDLVEDIRRLREKMRDLNCARFDS